MTNNSDNQITSHWISDDELDNLIADSLQRQDILEDINREVMGEIQRSTRRQTARRWARIAAFAFGLPLMLLCFGFGIYYICTNVEMQKQPYIWLTIILPTITMLAFVGKAVKHFSISEV